ncbi:hypothetical protein RclHR1_20340003 [Rhizophagus clarus]|uniref:ATP-dependent DNA helicase n=1 Tax=Rhizophagus clarus TaxID=94130 RepID=A0A2Z6R4H2_9GLOM|nr:hypothetical protein RclHR1_20340003 [Rhizophagus clarus]
MQWQLVILDEQSDHLCKSKWKVCDYENVLCIWPRPSPQCDGPQWDEFCHIKVILHVPHKSFQQLTENDALSWLELLIVILSRKKKKLRIYSFCGVRHRYTDIDSIDLNTFVQQSRNEDDLSAVNSTVDYRSLNKKQMIIFRKIETHYNAIIANHNQVDPLRLDIVIRQSGDSLEQRLFRDILMRLHDDEPTMNDWRTLATRFDDSSTTENNQFVDAIHITPRKVDIYEININSVTTKGLEVQLLLSKDPPSLPIAVLVDFDNYIGPAIISTEGKKVVPIIPIWRFWETKMVACSRLQILLTLAWAITVHKSQGLILPKVVIDLDNKEYVTDLSFVAVSCVSTLKNILFKPFSFERLQQIRTCKRLQERKEKEKHLNSIIFHN